MCQLQKHVKPGPFILTMSLIACHRNNHLWYGVKLPGRQCSGGYVLGVVEKLDSGADMTCK